MNKIKTQNEIVKIAEELRNKGKKLVTFSGSFDILHSGHINALKEAKSQGDILIILLNSDKSVKGYKGPNHPINSGEERALMLSSLEMVDYVLEFDELVPLKVLLKIRPDVHCNGSDWGEESIEKDAIKKYGGKMHILKWKDGFSTTSLLKKIANSYINPDKKAVFLDNNLFFDLKNSDYEIINSDVNEEYLKKLVQNRGFNLSKSWVVTKKEKGILAAKMVNAKSIIIGEDLRSKPNYYAENLKEAFKIILS